MNACWPSWVICYVSGPCMCRRPVHGGAKRRIHCRFPICKRRHYAGTCVGDITHGVPSGSRTSEKPHLFPDGVVSISKGGHRDVWISSCRSDESIRDNMIQSHISSLSDELQQWSKLRREHGENGSVDDRSRSREELISVWPFILRSNASSGHAHTPLQHRWMTFRSGKE